MSDPRESVKTRDGTSVTVRLALVGGKREGCQHGVRSKFGAAVMCQGYYCLYDHVCWVIDHRSGMLSSASISDMSANRVKARKPRITRNIVPIGDRNTRIFG